jgi:hypothetical protein
LKKFRGKPFPLFDSLFTLLEGTVATGDFAGMPPGLISSQPGNVESQSDFEELNVGSESDCSNDSHSEGDISPPRKKKRAKRASATAIDGPSVDAEQTTPRSRSAGVMIANAFQDLVNFQKTSSQPQGPVSSGPDATISSAVSLLMEQYGDILTDENIAIAADALCAPFKATIFLTLRGTARDVWIRQLIAKNSN